MGDLQDPKIFPFWISPGTQCAHFSTSRGNRKGDPKMDHHSRYLAPPGSLLWSPKETWYNSTWLPEDTEGTIPKERFRRNDPARSTGTYVSYGDFMVILWELIVMLW